MVLDEEIGFKERLVRWKVLAKGHPPEWLASYVASPGSRWTVITQEGHGHALKRRTAYLKTREDMPCWAFELARSYLDDVGEWPLYGMKSEAALFAYEEHQEPERAVREILTGIEPVWPDVRVLYVGEEHADQQQGEDCHPASDPC